MSQTSCFNFSISPEFHGGIWWTTDQQRWRCCGYAEYLSGVPFQSTRALLKVGVKWNQQIARNKWHQTGHQIEIQKLLIRVVVLQRRSKKSGGSFQAPNSLPHISFGHHGGLHLQTWLRDHHQRNHCPVSPFSQIRNLSAPQLTKVFRSIQTTHRTAAPPCASSKICFCSAVAVKMQMLVPDQTFF